MKIARIMGLITVAAVLLPVTASAGGHKRHGRGDAPADADTATMPAAYPLNGAFAHPPGNPRCYAIPIQAVYQFPAVLANQPGSEVGWLETNRASGLLGGRPYLYHP
jgi:hypothetical protein